MGHCRPRRPRLHEDPMKDVVTLYNTLDKIKRGKFRGFSKWTEGVPTPEVHAQRRLGRLRALNHGVEPRLGVSVYEARYHSRSINVMVQRIENLRSPQTRSKDLENANMHPVLLRRPLREEKKPKDIEQTPQKKKKKKNWDGRIDLGRSRAPQNDQPVKRLAPMKHPKALKTHLPGEIVVREGTPYCYTPKPESKLIDGTHLCDRYSYDDSRSRKKYFSDTHVERVKASYKEVLANPEGLATLITKPWKPPPPPVSTYDPQWSIDMRLGDLPPDFQATTSRHTLDDPIRPSSSRRPYDNVFTEPNAFYDENGSLMPVPSNSPKKAINNSSQTRTRPDCASVNRVHVANIKLKTVKTLDELTYGFAATSGNLPFEEGAPTRCPHGHQSPNSPVTTESIIFSRPAPPPFPLSTEWYSGHSTPPTRSGSRPGTPASDITESPICIHEDTSVSGDADILSQYRPKDEAI